MAFQGNDGDGGHHKRHEQHKADDHHEKSAAGKFLAEAWGHIGKAAHDVAKSNVAHQVEHTASDAIHNRGTAGKVANVAKEVGVNHVLMATPIGMIGQAAQLATGHKPESVKLVEKATGHHIDIPNVFAKAGAEVGKATQPHHEAAEHHHKNAKK